MLAGGAQVSSLYIQPHLGGDAALMAAMAKGLIEQNATDQAFINNYTEGFDEFKASIEALNWQELISQSGVTKSDIDTLVTLLRTSKNCILPGYGPYHHTQGVANIEGLAALALLRGHIGKPGAGLFAPARSQQYSRHWLHGFYPAITGPHPQRPAATLGFNLTQAVGLDSMARRRPPLTAICRH